MGGSWSIIRCIAGFGSIFVAKRPLDCQKKSDIPTYLNVGILTGVVPYTLIAWGQQFIPSGLGGVLFACAPLLTLFFGVVLFNVPYPTFPALTGAIVGLGGVALAFASPEDLSVPVLQGATATIMAAASYAVGGMVIQRQAISDIIAFSTVQLIPATIILVAVACSFAEAQLNIATPTSWIALIVLGVFCTSIPLVSLFAFVEREGATVASLTTFFIPFIALVIGVVLLDEPLSVLAFLGLVITLTGAYWVMRSQREN